MGRFAWGLIVGCVGSLAAAAAVVAAVYRRLERLRRAARQAERLAELGTLTGGLAHETASFRESSASQGSPRSDTIEQRSSR